MVRSVPPRFDRVALKARRKNLAVCATTVDTVRDTSATRPARHAEQHVVWPARLSARLLLLGRVCERGGGRAAARAAGEPKGGLRRAAGLPLQQRRGAARGCAAGAAVLHLRAARARRRVGVRCVRPWRPLAVCARVGDSGCGARGARVPNRVRLPLRHREPRAADQAGAPLRRPQSAAQQLPPRSAPCRRKERTLISAAYSLLSISRVRSYGMFTCIHLLTRGEIAWAIWHSLGRRLGPLRGGDALHRLSPDSTQALSLTIRMCSWRSTNGE